MSNEEMVEHLRNLYLDPDYGKGPDPVRYCDYCGEPMYEGDTVWVVDGDTVCEECARVNFTHELRADD